MKKFLIAEAEKARILGMHYNAMGKSPINEVELPFNTVQTIAKQLIDKVAKGEKEPIVTNGQYIFKTTNTSAEKIYGVILGFQSGLNPPFPLSYGGFNIDREIPESSVIQPQDGQALLTYNEMYTKPKTSEIRASNINNMYDMAGNISNLQAILNAHPKKQNIMAAITNFQKSNDPIKPLLQRNAKTFLVGSAPTPAATNVNPNSVNPTAGKQ